MSITLSTGLPEFFVDQFNGAASHACQQKESLFSQAVEVESLLNAEDKSFNMFGKLTLVAKSERNTKTPTTTITTGVRWASTDPFHQSLDFDKDDDLSMLVDPVSEFNTELRYAANRKKDSLILAAMDATVTSGRNRSGSISWASERGNTKYTRAATDAEGRTIAWDCAIGNCKAADTNMTIEKITLVKEYFKRMEVDDSIPIFGAISPMQATDLFGQEEYVNNDYSSDKPLATGQLIKNWAGINWIISNMIEIGTSNDVDADSNVYRCPFWAKDGILLAVQSDITTRISELPMQSYDQKVYIYMNMGAMRKNEDKVCYVECK